jgi:hypothetical protein
MLLTWLATVFLEITSLGWPPRPVQEVAGIALELRRRPPHHEEASKTDDKGKGVTRSSPLPIYTAQGGLRQAPGRAA